MYIVGDSVLIKQGASGSAAHYIGKWATIYYKDGNTDFYRVTCEGQNFPIVPSEIDDNSVFQDSDREEILAIMLPPTTEELVELHSIFNRIQNISVHDKRPTPGGYSCVVDSTWVSRHTRSRPKLFLRSFETWKWYPLNIGYRQEYISFVTRRMVKPTSVQA